MRWAIDKLVRLDRWDTLERLDGYVDRQSDRQIDR